MKSQVECHVANSNKLWRKLLHHWLHCDAYSFQFNNSDPKHQKQPLLGLIMLRNFVYDEDQVWNDGEIYDPKNGKTYSCKMTLKDWNTLDVRGYIGISLFGRTDTWKRQP